MKDDIHRKERLLNYSNTSAKWPWKWLQEGRVEQNKGKYSRVLCAPSSVTFSVSPVKDSLSVAAGWFKLSLIEGGRQEKARIPWRFVRSGLTWIPQFKSYGFLRFAFNVDNLLKGLYVWQGKLLWYVMQ